jgi:hypothetical protein
LKAPSAGSPPALQGLVAQHLCARLAYRGGGGGQLRYWRTKSGSEADHGADVFGAVEVKRAAAGTTGDTSGFIARSADDTLTLMKQTLQVLNELERKGHLGRYAIGGAMGATFYVEPLLTFDLDVFVVLPQAGAGLLSLAPL